MGEKSTKDHCSNSEKTKWNARAHRASLKSTRKKSGSFTVDKENSPEGGAKLATTIDGEAVHELVPENSSFCTKRKRMEQGSFCRDEHARGLPDAHTPKCSLTPSSFYASAGKNSKHARDSSVSQMDDFSNSGKQVPEQHKHTGPRQVNAQASTPTTTLRIEEEQLKVSTNVQNLRDERLIASGVVCSSVFELEEGKIASDISGFDALPDTAVIEGDSDAQSAKQHHYFNSNSICGLTYYDEPLPRLCRIHQVIVVDDDDSSDVDMPSQEVKGDVLKTVTSTLLCKENTVQVSEISTCSLTSQEASTKTSVVALEEANFDVQQSDMVQSHAPLSTETHSLLVQPVTDTGAVVLEEEANFDVQQSDMVQSHAPLSTETHSLLVQPVTDNLSRNSTHVYQMQLPIFIIPSSIEEPVPCMPEPLVSQLEPSGATHASMEELLPCMLEPLVSHPEPIGATHASMEEPVPCMPEPLVSRLERSGSSHAFSSEKQSLGEPSLENPLQQSGPSVIDTQLPSTSMRMSANVEHVQDNEDIIILDDFPVDDYPEINEVNVCAYLNPLEFDMQRLLEQATKTHADQILQLEAERAKELEEMQKRRLDVLRETYERLKMNYEKAYMNYLLAEAIVRKDQLNYLTFGFPETCTSQSMVVHAQRGGLQHCPAPAPAPPPPPPPLQIVNYASPSSFTSSATPYFHGSFRNSVQQSPSPHLISYMPSNLPVLSGGFLNQQSHQNFSMASSMLELAPLQSIRPENIQIPVGNRGRQAYQHPSWTRQYIRPQGSLNFWPVQLG